MQQKTDLVQNPYLIFCELYNVGARYLPWNNMNDDDAADDGIPT